MTGGEGLLREARDTLEDLLVERRNETVSCPLCYHEWHSEIPAGEKTHADECLISRLSAAEQHATRAEGLLTDIRRWATSRCPCENDEPKVCPLCDARVEKDRCKAVDAIFPKTLLARLDAALTPQPEPQP